MKLPGRIILITLIFLTLMYSCDIINPPEDIPAYISIDSFEVKVDNFEQGSASHMITDIWISVGGENLGVFVMPFTIPSLTKGIQTVTIRPGVKLNGISASRIDYPFYKPYIIDVELIEGEVVTIAPISTYKDECKFPFMEDFEDPGVGFVYGSQSDTVFVNQREIVREGRSSGAIYLTKDKDLFHAWLNVDLEIPENASPALLEFDYLNNNGFEVGMYLMEDGALEWSGLVYVRPSTVWKRMYVDLGSTATFYNETDLYRIAFLAQHDQKDSLTQGEIILDNIKVIHY